VKKYFFILLVLLVATGIISFLDLRQDSSAGSAGSSPDQSRQMYYMSELVMTSIANEGSTIPDKPVYTGSDTTTRSGFYNTTNGNCLLFRFSGEACDVCIDFVADKIREHFSDFVTNEKIFFIGTDINERLKDSYFGKPVTSLFSGDLGLAFEKYKVPFLFVLDREKTCKMIFIPDKAFPELTDLYLKTVKERFFESE
jgi:hypothetical protein